MPAFRQKTSALQARFLTLSCGSRTLFQTLMRIVSLLPSTTEIVCALGLDAELGRHHSRMRLSAPLAVDKPRLTASRISHETMTSPEIDHAVRSQLDGHGSIYDLDEAKLRALNPDLILTQELCEVCAVSYKTVERAARMFEADVKVVSLEPNTIDDIFENISMVGELTARSTEADQLVSSLDRPARSHQTKTAEFESTPAHVDARMVGACPLLPVIGSPNK